jgi:hypothetical protein
MRPNKCSKPGGEPGDDSAIRAWEAQIPECAPRVRRAANISPVDSAGREGPALHRTPLFQTALPTQTSGQTGARLAMRFTIVGFVAAFVILSSSPAQAAEDPLKSRLIAMEKQSWVAWQAMDAGFWDRFLSDDHVELNGYVGATGKKSVIDGIASRICHVASYKVGDFTFRRFDSHTALLIYRAEQDTTCGRVKVPSPVWATSLYQLRRGRWVNVLYGHSPVLVPPAKAR